MDQQILIQLRQITDEEKKILAGSDRVDWGLYTHDDTKIISARKLLPAGKLIAVRPHTRFIPFPAQTHDYIEVV